MRLTETDDNVTIFQIAMSRHARDARSMKTFWMEVKIRPRKATDRGGYYCMPLYTNIQHGKSGWRIAQCPECGAKCWRTPLAEIAEEQGARGLCTMCALKKGARVGINDDEKE